MTSLYHLSKILSDEQMTLLRSLGEDPETVIDYQPEFDHVSEKLRRFIDLLNTFENPNDVLEAMLPCFTNHSYTISMIDKCENAYKLLNEYNFKQLSDVYLPGRQLVLNCIREGIIDCPNIPGLNDIVNFYFYNGLNTDDYRVPEIYVRYIFTEYTQDVLARLATDDTNKYNFVAAKILENYEIVRSFLPIIRYDPELLPRIHTTDKNQLDRDYRLFSFANSNLMKEVGNLLQMDEYDAVYNYILGQLQ